MLVQLLQLEVAVFTSCPSGIPINLLQSFSFCRAANIPIVRGRMHICICIHMCIYVICE